MASPDLRRSSVVRSSVPVVGPLPRTPWKPAWVLVVLTLALSVEADEFDLSKLVVEANNTAALTQYHYFYDEDHISPWHQIPFVASDTESGKLLHFVCEIPRGTTAKNEIHKSVAFNPVIQDIDKHGNPRHYQYGPSLVNYGAIAQTWEDPEAISPDTGFGGDNDPIDVLQINNLPCDVGEVMPVRVLGCLALVDDDETDWKLIVTDARDVTQIERGNAATYADHAKLAAYRDIEDVPKKRVSELREWFRMYKTAEGKGENKFGLQEQAMDAAFAMRVAEHTHETWRALGPGAMALKRHHERSCTFGKNGPCWVDPLFAAPQTTARPGTGAEL